MRKKYAVKAAARKVQTIPAKIFLLLLLTVGVQFLWAQCPAPYTVSANTPSVNATTDTWTAPATGGPYLIRITAAGAKGGDVYTFGGGSGAVMQGSFIVQNGQQLDITAGAPGANAGLFSSYAGAGGGGGSGVSLPGTQTVLLIAGGGGGAAATYVTSGSNGSSGQITSGGQSIANGGTGGSAGSGSTGNAYSGGGGGLNSAGTTPVGNQAWVAANGGAGFNGSGGTAFNCFASSGNGGGGVGGGGAGYAGSASCTITAIGGGGGGYSGGGGGFINVNTYSGGGGGGSINYGSNQTNTAGANAGGGYVTIECLGALQLTSTTVSSNANPSFTGNPVVFTATVSNAGTLSPITEGTVTFKEEATILAADVALNASGQASFSTDALTEGSHNISAVYSGSGTYNTSNGSVVQTLNNTTSVSGNSFCNSLSGIAINDQWSATPYPSRIFVSGVPGAIASLALTLNGFTHPAPGEVSMMLVGPGGQRFVFLSGAGGDNAISNINLTLSDAASFGPGNGSIASGTYRPAVYKAASFPAPAPAGPFNQAAPFGTATFASVFGGISPNGTWSLYVVDDVTGNAGSIAGGWCLNFTLTIPCSSSDVIYVNKNATGANNGGSWANAFNNLQDALALTNSCSGVNQIWVAAGTYYPDEGTGQTDNDLNASFALKNNIAIYGGFNGTEATLNDRNWRTNVTVLSGDIDGDNALSNNAYHVTTGSGTDNTAILDGFTITGGNAICVGTCETGGQWGGGMLNISGSPSVSNCIFSGNVAAQFGGGMTNILSSPTITNCSFLGNSYSLVISEPHGGGAICNQGASPSIVNCVFSGNSTVSIGSAIYNTSTQTGVHSFINSLPTITNCTFSGNSAYYPGSNSAGGAIGSANGSSPTLTNCIFWNNRDNSGVGTASASMNGPAVITYSLVQGQIPAGTGNLDGTNAANDPLFVTDVDPTTAPTTSGDLHLQVGSPAVDKGSDAANATTTDLDGNNRKVDAITGGSVIDLGAYEVQGALQTFYRDFDGDTYGDPATTIQAVTAPDGYVSDNTDCNDSDKAINPATIWYKDADGDGYSDGTTKTQCERPADSKLATELTATTGDCDDANASLSPATVWYKDADNDGYGDGTQKTQCLQPAGYKLSSALTATSGDCNDNDAAINPATTWYKDADNDSYSDGTSQTQCTRPSGYKLSTELTATSGDCNDADAAINPAAVWYQDADNDGYSNGTTKTQCLQPAGYKLASALTATSGDCNDANAALNPATVWYKDMDNDGYSDAVTTTQCTRPTGYKLASEVTATTGDCNDADGSVHSPQTYYHDADGDGYGTLSTAAFCSSTPPAGYSTRAGDCDDTNKDAWQSAVLYVDHDNDGYTAGSQSVCYGTAIPAGYRTTSLGTDCNDNNPLVWRSATFYADKDGDGFTLSTGEVLCYGATMPVGYKISPSTQADCDDTKVLYQDKDGDGFGSTNKVACGGVTTSTDCNDNDKTIYAGAPEIPDGKDNNCNGRIDDGPPVAFYRDYEGDGFGDPKNKKLSSTPLPGYVQNNLDCNDYYTTYQDLDGDGVGSTVKLPCSQVLTNYDCNDNDRTVNKPQIYYRDNDGDSYGDAAQKITACSSTPPTGYVANSIDCNDNNAGLRLPITYFRDGDGDGYGTPAVKTTVCSLTPPTGYVANSTDCNDALVMYQDKDKDGWGSTLKVACGGVTNSKDCNDNNAAVGPCAPYTLHQGAAPGDEVRIAGFTLSAWPNPFGASTRIQYSVPQQAKVSLRVYDGLGRQVGVLVEGERQRGNYSVSYNSAALAQGSYYCQLSATTSNQTFTQAVKLVKTE